MELPPAEDVGGARQVTGGDEAVSAKGRARMLRRLVISAGILGLWLALLVSLGLIVPALALLRVVADAAMAPIRRRRRRSELTKEAWALNAEGVEHRRAGRAGAAVDAHERAVALFRQLADDRNEGLALNNLGLALMATSDDTGAIDAFERALSLLGRSGDRPAEGRVLANLGTLYRRLDRQETALVYWRQALTRLEADSPEHERMAELLEATPQ